MTISRADLLKELLPGLNELFGMEYEKHNRNLLGGNEGVHGLGRLHEGVDSDDAANEGLNRAQDSAGYTVRYKGVGR